jgi:uncharacterized membrane protein
MNKKNKWLILLFILFLIFLIYIIIYNNKKEGFIGKYYRPYTRKFRLFVNDYIGYFIRKK